MNKLKHPRMVSHSECKECAGGIICKALQRDLSRFNSNRQSKAAKKYVNIDSVANIAGADIIPLEEEIKLLGKKLKSYALPKIYIDVIVFVSVHGPKTKGVFGWAADRLEIPNWQTVLSIYQQGIVLLRERGYRR